MSDIEKKIEEPVVAPETTVAEPSVAEAAAPIVETSNTHITQTPSPAAEEPASVTETVAAPAEAEELKEIAPVSEGVLGYKGPGLLKSLRFSKKFFWLGDEPVEPKQLANYLRGEKPEVGNKNGAWAAYTGKGLLFFSKTAAEKATPASIINLADISDITDDGVLEFFFHYQHQKLIFQASSPAERDSWVAALKYAATEAKANAEGVTSSAAYKEHFAALSKPAVPAAAKKEEKADEKAEKKEEKKEEAAAAEAADKEEAKEEKKEDKSARKSRSQSRKRSSIFGAFNNNKKKEEPKLAEAEAAAAPVEIPVATNAAEAAPADVPAEAPATETAETTETPVAPVFTNKPATNKRASIFGQIQSRFSGKKENASAPAIPAKDDVAAPEVNDNAPVIPVVETETPLSSDISTPAATVPIETTSEAAPVEPEATPKVEKRKSTLPFGFGGKSSPGLLSRFGTKKNKKPSSEEAAVTSEKAREETNEAIVTEIPTNGDAPTESTPATEPATVAATA